MTQRHTHSARSGLWRLARWVTACIAGLLLAVAPEAQTRTVEIVFAENVVVETDSLNGTVRRMTGNVQVREDTTRLRAQSVVEYVQRREIILTGAVRIIAGDDTLTADRVRYDGNTKLSRASGNVRIGAEGGILYAPEATYNSRDKRAQFSGGGRLLQDGAVLTAPSGTYDTQRRFAEMQGPLTIEDSTGVLTALRGTYDARSQRADVVGEVHLDREQDQLDADSLVYFRRTERARAFGNVALDRTDLDTQEASEPGQASGGRRAILFGDALVYDGKADTAEMTVQEGRALLVSLERDSSGRVDTSLVRARRFAARREARGEQRAEILTASGQTRLWRDGLGAAADSALFVRIAPADSLDPTPPRDRLDLFGGTTRPTVWLDGSQLAGDSLWIVSGADRDSVLARSNAFAAQLDSTLGRLQQLSGDRMLGLVRDGDLRRLHVWPAAQAFYHQATADGLLDGAIRVGADSLVFRFDARGELREAGVFGDVDGTSYGPTIVPTGVQLPGFLFTPEERPTRDALLDGWEAMWLREHPDWSEPSASELAASGEDSP